MAEHGAHVYRVSKSFEVESGHMLSKHPSRCRYPHGHTRRIEVVVSSPVLDENDMVCDFAALKHALHEFLDRLDHSLAVNSADPMLPRLADVRERVVVFPNQDPTTEVLARSIFDFLSDRIASRRPITDGQGRSYALPPTLCVERVRVGETSSTWAEYGV